MAILGALLIMVLSWIFMIIFAVACAYYANTKGYNRWIWLCAGSLWGLIVLFFLPKISDMEETKREKQKTIGNMIGLAMAVASFVYGFAIGLSI